MNERIKELMIEAGSTGTYQVWFTRNEVHKLAELIVRECTNMLPNDSTRDENGVHMFYVIRKHFGVE